MTQTLMKNQKKCLSFSNQIKEIGTPLIDSTPINNFSFVRILPDGSSIFLSTYAHWLEAYFLEGFNPLKTLQGCPLVLSRGFSFWDDMLDAPVMQFTLHNDFDIANGMTMLQHHNNAIDFFHFCSSRNVPDMRNWYLNNTLIVQHFADYFRDKANTFLTQTHAIKYGPQVSMAVKTLLKQSQEKLVLQQSCQNDFLHKTTIEHMQILLQNNEVELNKREIQILKLMIAGHTAKTAAEVLHLSPRTIETYLVDLKKKMDCKTKSQLIEAGLKVVGDKL